MVVWLISLLIKVVVDVEEVDDDPWCGGGGRVVVVVIDRQIVTVSLGIRVLSLTYLIFCVCSCTSWWLIWVLWLWCRIILMHSSGPVKTNSDGQMLKYSTEEICSTD